MNGFVRVMCHGHYGRDWEMYEVLRDLIGKEYIFVRNISLVKIFFYTFSIFVNMYTSHEISYIKIFSSIVGNEHTFINEVIKLQLSR